MSNFCKTCFMYSIWDNCKILFCLYLLIYIQGSFLHDLIISRQTPLTTISRSLWSHPYLSMLLTYHWYKVTKWYNWNYISWKNNSGRHWTSSKLLCAWRFHTSYINVFELVSVHTSSSLVYTLYSFPFFGESSKLVHVYLFN